MGNKIIKLLFTYDRDVKLKFVVNDCCVALSPPCTCESDKCGCYNKMLCVHYWHLHTFLSDKIVGLKYIENIFFWQERFNILRKDLYGYFFLYYKRVQGDVLRGPSRNLGWQICALVCV